ncbi:uncharacterized protein LOC107795077 [Nicotiana tabacum]|uniref:Uncharacterized protein LOC107795077 n=1 Tax=Nicotiana tabacum TaxID=4097 RepID=A0A1S4A913_TOBAC|nr:uncharacterized protein LOC104114530 [Nicotiana tomentosiformis]XP_016473130.1 PREDICTED: uncharacterized protein LOC107795077 [Nicotiana tabacum]
MAYLLIAFVSLVFQCLVPKAYSYGHAHGCRSYCGNLTVDYPFALQPGCGHQGYRDLLYCINNVLMLHISSGSYRVLDIDYAYRSLTLDEPHMSTCTTIMLDKRGNGFVVERWREPYLSPMTDNVFMLLHCKAESPLFQGFSGKHLPCRNVAGMGCDDYYGCAAWSLIGPQRAGSVYGSGPPECCAIAYEAIKDVNLTRLACQGYSSAYNLAPLRLTGPDEWSYGIRVKYSVQGNETFCKACEATGGSCGYDVNDFSSLCMCGSWNSTSNCDSVPSASHRRTLSFMDALTGFSICVVIWDQLTIKLGL